MNRLSKIPPILLVATLAVSGLFILLPTNAQTIPAPSPPQFTVTYVDRSYTVPITTTQTTDPFTGQQVTQTSGGQYVKNQAVDIKIKNPQTLSVTLSNGSVAHLYYSIRTKGHFSDNWGDPNDNRWTTTWEDGDSFTQVVASTSDYTVVTLVIGSPNDILMGYADVYIPAGGQEDFQVQASFGYQYTTYAGLYPTGTAFFSYADSGWSNIQTITIPTSSNSVQETSPTSTTVLTQSPTPNPSRTVPEFSVFTVLPLFVVIPLIAFFVVKKRKCTKTYN